MCERSKININPDVGAIRQMIDSPKGVRDIYKEQRIARTIYEMNIGDYVGTDDKTSKYEVGPIFGDSKTGSEATKPVEATNENIEWFRKYGDA